MTSALPSLNRSKPNPLLERSSLPGGQFHRSESCVFDQRTMSLMVEHDPLVQHYRTFFEQLDWSVVPEPGVDPSRPGRRPHPKSAYIKALLIKICEGFEYISQLRRFLLRHPLLVLSAFRTRLVE